jgi:hypothetical protein
MKHFCPNCGAATDSAAHADFPFCSERCRWLDLGAWASGKYRFAAPAFDEAEPHEDSALQSRPADADESESGK